MPECLVERLAGNLWRGGWAQFRGFVLRAVLGGIERLGLAALAEPEVFNVKKMLRGKGDTINNKAGGATDSVEPDGICVRYDHACCGAIGDLPDSTEQRAEYRQALI